MDDLKHVIDELERTKREQDAALVTDECRYCGTEYTHPRRSGDKLRTPLCSAECKRLWLHEVF